MSNGPLFIFDLDNTLYPPEVTLWRIVDERIEEYVRRKLGTDPETDHRMRKAFLAELARSRSSAAWSPGSRVLRRA